MKVLGITYFNFRDKATQRVNKGVNVHVAKEVLETMGVGFQSDKIKFSIENFNELWKATLPTADESKLDENQVKTLAKYLDKEVTVLFDTKQVPVIVQFKGA